MVNLQLTILRNKNQAGFTLIEVIIYSALIAIVIGGSLGVIYQIFQGADSLNKQIIVEQDANFILSKVRWVLTDIDSVVSPATINSSSTVLTVNKKNFPSNPVTVQLQSGNLVIRQGSSLEYVLNHGSFFVDSVIFERQSYTASSTELISASFKIKNQDYLLSQYIEK